MTVHRIYTEELDDDRSYWECDCGTSGSASTQKVDIASDKHIPEDDHRVDVNKPHHL